MGDQYILTNDYPVVELECEQAFNGISDKEKHYAHHLSLASWQGSLIVYLQTSGESPIIFSLLHKVFSNESIQSLKESSMSKGITEEEFKAFLVYGAVFYSNCGNYKGFGDIKFVPNLSVERLELILRSSKVWQEDPVSLALLWNKCKGPIYSLSDREKQLSFPNKGVTAYMSKNCVKEDADFVNEYLTFSGYGGYNSRLFKTIENGEIKYEIRLASAETSPDVVPLHEYNGSKFVITRGDYSPILATTIEHLKNAQNYVSNEKEKNMLEYYIKSFQTGSLNDHKDGSRQWVQNKKPIIETYIGFIETYRDPAGIRGEFEGFVAMVNKSMTEKFTRLVNQAESLLPLLPWPAEFEKDKFLQPDFTSLDVLAFAGSGIPAGINIPNYDEIRQVEGFKNVSLGNIIPGYHKDPKTSFLTKEDAAFLDKYRTPAFEVQVGLHELLGHGSGKMFYKIKDEYNFNKSTVRNPLNGEEIDLFYKEGETYDSKFTTLSSAYEECRAECVGLYLSLENKVVEIFGHKDKEAEDIIYANWLSMVHAGLKGLENYQPSSEIWLQAHSRARFVILRVLLEAGEGLLNIEETVLGEDLLLTLDRSKISTVGKQAIGNFLLKLQVYKTTGNIVDAKELFEKYSEVSFEHPHPFGKWRAIVLAHKKPRKIFVQPNTIEKDGKIVLKNYEATPEGVIESFVDRYSSSPVDPSAVLYELWEKDEQHF